MGVHMSTHSAAVEALTHTNDMRTDHTNLLTCGTVAPTGMGVCAKLSPQRVYYSGASLSPA